jgi:5-methylcytosine-specific restriction endonuclease McrA
MSDHDDLEPDMQLCRVCREEKFLSEFQSDGRGGLNTACRACTNYQRVVWAHSTPERHHRALKMRKEYTQRRKAAPGSHTQAEWEARMASYLHRCAYCGASDKALVREHVVPVSAGGTNHIWNLVPACQSCNARKLDRTDFPPPSPPLVCCSVPLEREWYRAWQAEQAQAAADAQASE